jgi:hypothetical protein
MIVRTKTRLVAPLLAMSMALVLAASASAQDRQYQRSQSSGVSLQINFGSTPHWSRVPGTQVREIRQGDRSDYDVFQYGRSYYAYNHRNDRWYMSRRWRGQFRLIDDRAVPSDLRRVPRDHWRYYPTSWEGRDNRYDQGSAGSSRYDRGSDGSSATLRVTFGSTPRWGNISGTRVETVPVADRRDYDVFRYDNTYYAYNNNRWYSSQRETGDFTVIDDRTVPSELSRVPRDQWHSYPATWQNQNPNGTPPGQDRRDGVPPGQEKKNRNHRNGS